MDGWKYIRAYEYVCKDGRTLETGFIRSTLEST